MPTTSWEVANREIQRPLGFEAFSTTTNIATNNVVISTELGNRWNQDDSFNGWFVIIRGANNDEVVRRVTDYTGSSGTLTFAGAVLGGTESGATTCEVSRFHPDDVRRAYNRARQDLFPRLSAHKDHRGIVTDIDTLVYPVPTALRHIDRIYLGRGLLATHSQNLLTDGGFEDWSSDTALSNWTLSGTNSTVNKESQTTDPSNHMILTGSYSARLYVPDNNTTLLETLTPSVATQMAEVSMTAYVYCRVASSVTLSLDGDNNTSNYHKGTGWELLQYTNTLDINDTSFTAGFYVNGATTASTSYLDRAVVWVGPPSAPEADWRSVEGWEYVPPLDGASDGGQVFLGARPRDHEVLRMVGRGLLSSVSADSDTIEIDGELLVPLYEKVRSLLAWERAGGDPDSGWAIRAREFDLAYREAINGTAVVGARPSLRVNHRVF